MIAPSEFNAISQAALGGVVLALTEKYNGENSPLPYFHRRFLKPVYSLDGTWSSIQINNRAIVADIVSLDASLPLKTRPSAGKANGELPKIGTKRSMNETELRQLRLMMQSTNPNLVSIRKAFFKDTEAVYLSVLEQWEALFLEGISTGSILTNENYNVGTGIRVDFGYLASNLANASIVWGNANYTAVGDLVALYDKSVIAGQPIRKYIMRRAQMNQILASADAKELFANTQGFNASATTFKPTLEQLNTALQTNYGFDLEVIERSVTYEKNGVQTVVNPFKLGNVIGLSTEQVGSLVYSEVEENTARSQSVDYATGENNMLIKQYRLVEPSLKQMTASEAVSLPVISETLAIWKLDVLVAAV